MKTVLVPGAPWPKYTKSGVLILPKEAAPKKKAKPKKGPPMGESSARVVRYVESHRHATAYEVAHALDDLDSKLVSTKLSNFARSGLMTTKYVQGSRRGNVLGYSINPHFKE